MPRNRCASFIPDIGPSRVGVGCELGKRRLVLGGQFGNIDQVQTPQDFGRILQFVEKQIRDVRAIESGEFLQYLATGQQILGPDTIRDRCGIPRQQF